MVSQHPTAAEAFAEIDRLADVMQRSGVAAGYLEMIVVDQDDRIVQRPGSH